MPNPRYSESEMHSTPRVLFWMMVELKLAVAFLGASLAICKSQALCIPANGTLLEGAGVDTRRGGGSYVQSLRENWVT